MKNPRQNQVLLNVLHKRWPRTGQKFLGHTISMASKADQLIARKAYSEDGWFIRGCETVGEAFVVSALKPWKA